MIILDKESMWHGKSVRKTVLEHIEKPLLNEEGGNMIQVVQELGSDTERDSCLFVMW